MNRCRPTCRSSKAKKKKRSRLGICLLTRQGCVPASKPGAGGTDEKRPCKRLARNDQQVRPVESSDIVTSTFSCLVKLFNASQKRRCRSLCRVKSLGL